MSQAELRKFFNFNESDLAANRENKLSPKQEKYLQEREKSTDRFMIGVGIAIIILGLALSYTTITRVMAEGISTLPMSQLLLGIGLPWGLCGFFAFKCFQIAFSKNDNSVQSVEGKVNFVRVEKTVEERRSDGGHDLRKVQQYELRVGGVTFEDVDDELLNLINQGDMYAFYYTKQTKLILSAEEVKKGK
jgi:hypothetical protein